MLAFRVEAKELVPKPAEVKRWESKVGTNGSLSGIKIWARGPAFELGDEMSIGDMKPVPSEILVTGSPTSG